MDITSFALKADTTFLNLTHPVTGEALKDGDTPVGVNLYGPGTPEFQAAQLSLQNKALRRQASKAKVEASTLRAEADAFLAACTHSVQALTIHGETPANRPAFLSLYADPQYAWLREQVDAFLADNQNFLGESKKG